MVTADSIWTRLKQNRDANAPVFRRASIAFERIATLRCPVCGLEESALFWSPVRLRAATARFSCPACSGATARYDLRHNRAHGPADVRRILVGTAIVLAMLMLSGWLVVQLAPQGDQLAVAFQATLRRAGALAGDFRDRAMALSSYVERALRHR